MATLAFDGSVWVELDAVGPSARQHAAAATLGDRLVLFGGNGGATKLGDTWAFDGASWSELPVAGPPAQAAGMATAFDGELVFFGGADGYSGTPWTETWIFDGSSWAQLAVSGPVMDYGKPCLVTRDRP